MGASDGDEGEAGSLASLRDSVGPLLEAVGAAAGGLSGLRFVARKEFLLERTEREGLGAVSRDVVEAGGGMVDWTAVFAELARSDFDGPLSIHCEFHVTEDDFMAAAAREAAFFLGMRERVGESGN